MRIMARLSLLFVPFGLVMLHSGCDQSPLGVCDDPTASAKANQIQISVSSTTTSGTLVNLATTGPRDWSHWGVSATSSWSHKALTTPLISNYTKIGTATVTRFTSYGYKCAWTGGTTASGGVASTTGTITGLGMAATNCGFQIKVQASKSERRTLLLLLATNSATGKVTASLNDGVTPSSTSTLSSSGYKYFRVSIPFAAAADGTQLTVKWTRTSTAGTIRLQAAALSSAPLSTTQAPTFSPAPGTYYNSASISLASATANASIYYTTDGTVPTLSSTKYSGPITITSSKTIRAIADASGYLTSAATSAAYTIVPNSAPVVNLPSITTDVAELGIDYAGKQFTFYDADGDPVKIVLESGSPSNVTLYQYSGSTCMFTWYPDRNVYLYNRTYTIYLAAQDNRGASTRFQWKLTIGPHSWDYNPCKIPGVYGAISRCYAAGPGEELYAGGSTQTEHGTFDTRFFKSTTSGMQWVQIYNSNGEHTAQAMRAGNGKLFVGNRAIYAGAKGSLLVLNDNGSVYDSKDESLFGQSILADIHCRAGKLLIGTYREPYQMVHGEYQAYVYDPATKQLRFSGSVASPATGGIQVQIAGNKHLYLGYDGIYRTETSPWQTLSSNPLNIAQISADPVSGNVVYAIANSKLYKSIDGGASYARVLSVTDDVTWVTAENANCAWVIANVVAPNMHLIWYTQDGFQTVVREQLLANFVTSRVLLAESGRGAYLVSDYSSEVMKY